MPWLKICALAVLLALSGCTNDGVSKVDPAAPPPRTTLPAEKTVVAVGADAAELALATSRALFRHSPAVVLVGDEASVPKAASTAVELGVPLLVTTPAAPASPGAAASPAPMGLDAELDRLAPQWVVPVGDVASQWLGSRSPAPRVDPAALTEIKPAKPLSELLVLAIDDAVSRAAIATARASGARVTLLANADPRATAALSGQDTTRVLGLGAVFGPVERLRQRVDTATAGVMLPGGGQLLFPGRRLVALYGHPGDTQLGSLGEQGVDAAVARAKKVASTYSSLVKEPVVPAFEIITTVASAGAGADGDYSSESSAAHLRPWIDAAGKAGIYVVLDLQPGLTDFLTQAKRYAEFLSQPHVGLALDPEWRLKPGQRHMQVIGSVSAAEINETSAWLAGLTREHRLPQKLLMLHQFRLDMITNRSTVDTSHDELQIVIHADGFGSRGQKLETWRALHLSPPPNVWWGWKNFYDEDQPTFTPAETFAVKPSPVFVSYQ